MAEFKVNTYTINDQIMPRIVALINGGFVITWSSNEQDGSGHGIWGLGSNGTANRLKVFL